MRASATVCSAEDWYDTFMGCQEITHVLTYDTLAESLLDTLGLTSTGSDTDDDDEVKQRGKRRAALSGAGIAHSWQHELWMDHLDEERDDDDNDEAE